MVRRGVDILDSSMFDPVLQLSEAGPSSDPNLPSATLHQFSNNNHEDPLKDFARRVVESENPYDGHNHEHEHDDHHHLFGHSSDLEAAVREAEALDMDEHERERLEAAVNGINDDEGEERNGMDELHSPNMNEDDPHNGRIGNKRRRLNGTKNIPEELMSSKEIIRAKKDNHKEVERRRRENINEGITEISKHIPSITSKMGKSQLLKHAADYIVKIKEKENSIDLQLEEKDSELRNLQDEVARLRMELEEEQKRSMNLEQSWREAEDRAASSGFELEKVKRDLDETKMRLLETRR